MKMNKRTPGSNRISAIKRLSALLIIALLLVCSVIPAAAATPPDIIHQMTVTLTPQPDGSFNINYKMDYEATTDFPADIQYLEVGVPNPDFVLLDYSPSPLLSGASENTNGGSWVHLDFTKLPKAGDRFQLDFTIMQRSLLNSADNNVSFQFRPGWFDFAEIKEMKVVLDTSPLQSPEFIPQPDETGSGQAIWVTRDMKTNEKTVLYTITCTRSSFSKLYV
jgi:hypothetical protein